MSFHDHTLIAWSTHTMTIEREVKESSVLIAS